MVPLSLGCGSAVFAASATLAPSCAARNAIASPMPRLPPDTNSVLPLRDVITRTPLGFGSLRKTQGTPNLPQAISDSGIRMQNAAARFRQRKCREEEHAVSQYGKNRDGVGERSRGRERADQEREQRTDAAPEIIAEALAGSA